MEGPLWRVHILLWSITKHGHLQAILVSEWPFFLKSPPLKPLGQINRNMAGIIYGMSSMNTRSVNKHGQHRQFLFLIGRYIKKQSSPLKLPSQMNRNLVGSIYMYGRLCIKFPQSRMKGERHRLSPLSL